MQERDRGRERDCMRNGTQKNNRQKKNMWANGKKDRLMEWDSGKETERDEASLDRHTHNDRQSYGETVQSADSQRLKAI